MDRRKVLGYIGFIGVSSMLGCLGGQESQNGEQQNGNHEELPEGITEEEFISGPVPEQYRTAMDLAGNTRNPENLVPKDSVSFGEASEIEQAGEDESCETCAHYIPDKNEDSFGACTKVKGYIGPEDWCSLWEPIEHENHTE